MYHLTISGPDYDRFAYVSLVGQMRVGDRIVSNTQSFTLHEHDLFKGETLIPYHHDKIRRQLHEATGILPQLRRLTVRGDQSWMNDHDRRAIAYYRQQAEQSRPA